MANLTPAEKALLERLLRMKDGYVLDFSNRAFRDFVLDSVGRDIYGGEYDQGGGSKANLLRCFWRIESGPVVGKLIEDLVEYLHVARRVEQPGLATQCLHVALRLQAEGDNDAVRVATTAGPVDAAPRRALAMRARPGSGDERAERSAGATGAGAGEPVGELGVLVDELARLVLDHDTAKALLRRARYPLEFLPDFRAPFVFWDEIVAQVAGGRSLLEDLVEVAVTFYPRNSVFLEWRERIGARAAGGGQDPSRER